jgi:hypothetical protein
VWFGVEAASSRLVSSIRGPRGQQATVTAGCLGCAHHLWVSLGVEAAITGGGSTGISADVPTGLSLTGGTDIATAARHANIRRQGSMGQAAVAVLVVVVVAAVVVVVVVVAYSVEPSANMCDMAAVHQAAVQRTTLEGLGQGGLLYPLVQLVCFYPLGAGGSQGSPCFPVPLHLPSQCV